MSTLTNGDTLNATVNISKQTGTKITLSTENSYVDKNIELTVNAPTATPSYTGGALSDQDATLKTNGAVLSTTNLSGVKIVPFAEAGRTAVTRGNSVNGWVTSPQGTTVSNAIAAQEWNGDDYYLNGVVLPASSSFFSIISPDGNESLIGAGQIDISHIEVSQEITISTDAQGNTTITGVGNYANGDEVSY